MEKKTKFSIIIPIYNCEEYLERCIKSITSQIKTGYELILIDDGSTDNSGKICDKYSINNKNLVVIHKNNEGQSKARNDALDIAKGEYILFADSDDYLDLGYFKEIDNILKNIKNVDLINFGFYSDVDDTKLNNLSSDKINYTEKMYKNHAEIKKDFVNLWDNTMLYNIWNKVYLRKIIEDNDLRFYQSDWGEDVEFNKQYLNHINNFYNSNKCFYHYVRERRGASTKKYKNNFFEIRKNEFIGYNEYFNKWNIEKGKYYEFSCRRFIERLLGCIENIYCSKLKFKERYKEIKRMIKDPITRETLKYAKPKSKKIKLMLVPIRMKLTLSTMLMGKIFHVMKSKFPALFNKLKNRR